MLGRQNATQKGVHRIQMTRTLSDAYGDVCVPELQDDMAKRLTPCVSIHSLTAYYFLLLLASKAKWWLIDENKV